MTNEHTRNRANATHAVTEENLNELMMVPLITHHLASGSINSTPQAMVSDGPTTDLKKYIMSYHFGEKSGRSEMNTNLWGIRCGIWWGQLFKEVCEQLA